MLIVKTLLAKILGAFLTEYCEVSNTTYKNGALILRKSGKVVHMNCANDFIRLPAGGYTTYVTIPERFRPPQTVLTMRQNGASPLIVMLINPSGIVQFYNYGSAITTATNGNFQTSWVLE